MSLQREDFLLSYLKTPSVDPVGIWTREPRSADRRSPNWANQAAVSTLSSIYDLLEPV